MGYVLSEVYKWAAIGLAVALLVASSVILGYHLTLAGVRADLVQAQKDLGAANLSVQIAQADASQLRTEIAKQNVKIRKWELQAEAAEQRARTAVDEVARTARERKTALAKIGKTPEDMNRWLAEIFP
jgi:hypothetical protein